MDISNLLQFEGSFFPNHADGTETKMDQNVKKRFSGKEVDTVMSNSTQKSRGQATDPKVWKILLGMNSMGPLTIALASVPNGGYAEVTDNDTGNCVCALMKVEKGATRPEVHYKAAEVSPLGVWSEYGAKRRGTALLAAHLAWAVENDAEVKGIVNNTKIFLNADPESDDWDDEPRCDSVGKSLCQLSNNVYYTYKNNMDINPTLERLRQDDMKLIEASVTKITYGDITRCKPQLSSDFDVKKGMYDINPSRVLTKEEEALVPIPSKSFKYAQWMMTLAQDVQESSEFEEPFRVIMLYGPSGTGKTQACGGLAYLWNRPKLTWSSDPDSDEFKLVGTIMPNTEGGEKIERELNLDEMAKLLSLPTFDDIDFDFESSYEKLFEKKPTKYSTPAECYKELTQRIMKSNINNKDFVFVKSNIIRALENGWVIEIQEPTVIKRASVLVALNAMLECDCKETTITLPTGASITRHPEAIVIYTTNRDYAGCLDLQSSVLSRIDCIRRVPNPEEDVLVSRTMAKTSCKDKTALGKMAKVINAINDYCRKKGIADGVCGPREFQNWVKKAMIIEKRNNGDNKSLSEDSICKAACSTLFEHISQVDEDREDVITAVFNKQYKETIVITAKKAYEAGLC